MAEEFNPTEEGLRIANEYLSKRTWAREWRQAMNRQVYPGFQREEFEGKERQCDQQEEEAEAVFSTQIDRYRHDPSPQAKEVLQTVLDILGKRTDLGFFARRIVERLRRELGPI